MAKHSCSDVNKSAIDIRLARGVTFPLFTLFLEKRGTFSCQGSNIKLLFVQQSRFGDGCQAWRKVEDDVHLSVKLVLEARPSLLLCRWMHHLLHCRSCTNFLVSFTAAAMKPVRSVELMQIQMHHYVRMWHMPHESQSSHKNIVNQLKKENNERSGKFSDFQFFIFCCMLPLKKINKNHVLPLNDASTMLHYVYQVNQRGQFPGHLKFCLYILTLKY